MQIVIDIPNSTFTDLKKKKNRTEVDVAVLNGTPLPKGHGRLKDADAICKDIISALGIRNEDYLLEAEEAIYKRIKNAPTIIEADEEKVK